MNRQSLPPSERRVWFSDGGQFSEGRQSLGEDSSENVVLDGNGDLDALVGNASQPNRRLSG